MTSVTQRANSANFELVSLPPSLLHLVSQMPLFENVSYHLSYSLAESTRLEISRILNSNAAIEVPIDLATHILSDTIEFEGCDTLQKGVVCVTVSVSRPRIVCVLTRYSRIGWSAVWSLVIFKSVLLWFGSHSLTNTSFLVQSISQLTRTCSSLALWRLPQMYVSRLLCSQ